MVLHVSRRDRCLYYVVWSQMPIFLPTSDPFSQHFEKDLEESVAESITKPDGWKRTELQVGG